MQKISKSERTRQKIIDSALQCILERGWENTNFYSIAEYAGVTQPLIVHYYKKRENILPEIYNRVFSGHIERLEAKEAEIESAREKIIYYFRFYYDMVCENPELFRIYLLRYYRASYDPQEEKVHFERKLSGLKRMEKYLREGVKSGEFNCKSIKSTAQLIHDCIQGLFINRLISPRLVSDAALVKRFEQMVDQILD